MIVVLDLQGLLALSRKVDGDTSHTFRAMVFDTVTDGRFERHDFGEFLVRAERQTEVHAFVLVHLQDLFDMTDIHFRAGRDIARCGDRGEPFGNPNEW